MNKKGNGKIKIMGLFIRPKRLYVSSLAVKAKLKHASYAFILSLQRRFKAPREDGAVLHHKDAHEVVIFNPSHIRSQHASFNPDYLDSPDLLASLVDRRASTPK